MFFWRKKKKNKFNLPYVEPEEKQPRMSLYHQEFNIYAEKFAHSKEEDGKLKNYIVYYRDRDYADVQGDPLITVIQAYSQAEAELAASHFDKNIGGIIAVDANIEVDFPNNNSAFAWPKGKKDDEKPKDGLEILRRRRSSGD